MAPVPIDGLLPGAQLDESMLLVVFGLVPQVRAIFIAVPGVVVVVACSGHPEAMEYGNFDHVHQEGKNSRPQQRSSHYE